MTGCSGVNTPARAAGAKTLHTPSVSTKKQTKHKTPVKQRRLFGLLVNLTSMASSPSFASKNERLTSTTPNSIPASLQEVCNLY
jgi:hypothetical protein